MDISEHFNGVMSTKSNEDLIDILENLRDDYQPAAILAAEKELQKRDLSASDRQKALEDLSISKEKNRIKAEAPLSIFLKILVFLMPGLVTLVFIAIFKADGYEKKFNAGIKWTFYGVTFYIALITLGIFTL